MNPLGLDIWLVVVAAFCMASFTLYALARFSPYEWYNPRPWRPQPLVNQFTVSNSVWFITGTLLRQGSGVSPKVPTIIWPLPSFGSALSLLECASCACCCPSIYSLPTVNCVQGSMTK
jgi:Ligand-gated ion channel